MNQILPNAPLPQPAAEAANRVKLGRRGLFSVALAAGGALTFGLSVLPNGASAAGTPVATVNIWLVINADNSVTYISPASEMGQGIMSGLVQILAEELPLNWSTVDLMPSPFNPIYGGQVTGGSYSTRAFFQPMLLAGAAIRSMLLTAAAAQFGGGVAAASLQCKPNNTVLNPANGKTLTYAQLATAAAAVPVPASPTLLSTPATYKLIGTAMRRPDLQAKITGAAKFGIDVTVPGMVFASVKQAPVFGATVKTMGSAPAGTTNVVNLGDAVAVVAGNTWAAIQGARSVAVTWTVPAGNASVSSASISAQANTLLAATSGVPVAETVGNLTTSMAGATKTLSLTYSVPYLPHAAMEVPNCTASVTATSCEIWTSTQVPGWVAGAAAAITGLPASAITVHTTLIGGGFGRKLETDYVIHAIKTSKAIGKPVKLTWSREDDFAHDKYRPMAVSRIVVGVDNAGHILGWNNRVVTPSVLNAHFPGAAVGGMDKSALDGALGESGLVYAMAARLVDYQMLNSTVPVGWWRSVGHSYTCFAVESAIDEIALALGKDPLAYRQMLLAAQPRHLAVLNAAATQAGYSPTAPAGTAWGMALLDGFGSITAAVVKVTQVTSGTTVTPKVLAVSCAIDCGTAVNPDQVASQMQGGVTMGMTSAMWGRAPIANGAASLNNFDSYYMARMKDVPPVSMKIINSGAAIGGVGETMVPPMAPALANAFARLTGTRKRSLPLFTTFPAGNGD
jgi:isoquinoline 1-oxidoreductase beta subunit